MRLISSLSFSGHLYDKICHAARAGFDGIEIYHEDMVGYDGSPADVAGLAQDQGIAIATLQSLRDVEGLTGAARAHAFQRAARFMELATALGAPMLMVSASSLPEADPDPARAAADLAELADMAAGHGLRLGFEALAVSRHTRTPLQAWQLVEAAGRPNLGLVIGSIHHFAAGGDRAVFGRIDPARVFLLRLADAMVRQIDVQSLRQANRVLPGQGVLPLGDFMRDFRAAGYRGPFSVEVFDAEGRGLPPVVLADDAMRALMLTEALAEGRAVDHSLVGQPAFLHLQAGGDSAAAAIRVLSAFGFAEAGRSPDGAERLFAQGDLSAVVTTLAEAGAPLRVAGIGLISAQPEKLRRAADPQGRRSEPAGEPHLGNPFGLARLDAPFDIGIYLDREPLTRSRFAAGLVPAGAEAARPPAHVTGIDHLAQAFPMRAVLSGLLYYRAALDFALIQRQDVLDPHGAIHSYSLRSESGGFALNLNAAEGASTTTGRFLGKQGVAPIHHVAFACHGLMDLAERIDPSLILHPPVNYYENLALRVDLPADRIDRLRARNLFYDEDGGGSFLQLYTRTIDGVFFELVERCGDYTGFGAANATARILAQSVDYESR